MELAKKSFKLKSVIKPDVSTVLYTSVYYLIAAVLLFSGIVKILDPLPLLETLKLITIVPESLQIIIATLLPIVEIGLAVLMLLKIKSKITLIAVTGLFASFLAFSIYGMAVGFGGDCGCFGDVLKSDFGFWMILRNTIFLLLSFQIIWYKFKIIIIV